MALIATFDLNTQQYDAVNAFSNSAIDELTYCKPFAAFIINSIV